MGRRYYCDYCDKAFIDDLEARKRHLQSANHLNCQKVHYEAFKEPKEILATELAKTPCLRFHQSGYCSFAEFCKYSHYTQEELWNMQCQIEAAEKSKKANSKVVEIPSVESWLCKYEEKHAEKRNGDLTNKTENHSHVWWSYPEIFEGNNDLPPSIRKFKAEDFIDSDFQEWGEQFVLPN